MEISLTPFENGFGALVRGFSLGDRLHDGDVRLLHEAIVRYGFLLHAGEVSAAEAQVRFTEQLGEPVPDGREGRLFKIFDAKYRFSYWHCDGVFYTPPTRLSIQHMVVGGAETQLLNGYEALRRMPPTLAQKLEGAKALYNLSAARKVNVPPISALDAGPFPLAWAHPVTKRPSLYVNLNYAKLVALGPDDGHALLEELEAYLKSLTGLAGVYHVVPSAAGNTIIVDNRSTLHAGPIDPESMPPDRKIQWTGTVGPEA